MDTILPMTGMCKNHSSQSLVAAFLFCLAALCARAPGQDVVETPTQTFRGRVTMADTNSVTLEMLVQGRPQEITIPRDRVRRIQVTPPPSVIAGIEAYESGDWRSARLNLERVILNFEGLDVDWARKGMVYFGRASLFADDHENAGRAFSMFLRAHPDHELVIEARLGLADVERARGNLDEALEMFKALAEPYDRVLRPDRDELPYAAETYLGMGRSLEAKGELEAAFDAYVRIIALYPSERIYPEALYRCAVVSTELNEFDKAERYLAELIDEYPGTDFARSGLQLRSSIERKKLDAAKHVE